MPCKAMGIGHEGGMVQLASLISQTHRCEGKRTCQAIATVSIVRPSKQEALVKRSEARIEEDKEEIDSCQG